MTMYFQGFGLALSWDYAGGNMARDDDGNGIFSSPEGVEVREGAQCDTAEYLHFIHD